jgi:hypothetical protein
MADTPPRMTNPTGKPRPDAHPAPPPARHRQGEGVTVIPDTGKRGSRPKTDPSPYPPRPTAPPPAPDSDSDPAEFGSG